MLLVAVLLLLLELLRVPSEGFDGFDDDDEYLLGRMQSIIGLEIPAAASRTGRWTTTTGGANAMRRRANMMLYRRSGWDQVAEGPTGAETGW